MAAAIRRALGTLALVVGVAPLVGFAWFLTTAGSQPSEPERPTDGIAVLTGGADRLETGLRLLQEGRAGRLLVSGVHPDVTLADLARIGGVAEAMLAERVAIGHGAATTRGNALEVAAWARAERLASVRVVTAGYHMPRALLELRRTTAELALVPHPVVPARLRGAAALGQWRTWRLLGHEYLKLLAAGARLSGVAEPATATFPPAVSSGRGAWSDRADGVGMGYTRPAGRMFGSTFVGRVGNAAAQHSGCSGSPNAQPGAAWRA